MHRFGTWCIVTVVALLAAAAAAGPVDDRWAIGVEGGVWKLVEGYWDHSNVDEFAGLSLRKGLSPRWSHGTRPAHRFRAPRRRRSPARDAGWTFDNYTNLATEISTRC